MAKKSIRSNKIRASAKGEDCTFNIPDICNYNPETTVLCHLPDESKGMGLKADDISSAYGCSSCHDLIDGRRPHSFPESDIEWFMRRAMVRTWRKMIEKGLIIIK